MNLNLLPHSLAIALAAAAFGLTWLIGLANDVSVDSIALRAVLGAAVFWFLGLLGGRVIVSCIYDAIGEQFSNAHASDDKSQRRQ